MSRHHQEAIPKRKNDEESTNGDSSSRNHEPSAHNGDAYPAKNLLTIEELYDPKTDLLLMANLPRHKVLMKHLKRRGILHEEAALRIIREVTEVLREEPNVITVAEPVAICGDVHGHFNNLLKILVLGVEKGVTNFLFLGNYVNRGNLGIEVLLYLWCLKLNHPERFVMLRGNHECRHLTERLSFQKECWLKYSDEVYEACIEAFKCLPLAAVVNKQFFCVHGGLSPEISTIEDIRNINRFVEPPLQGPLCDLLWSDPVRDYPTIEYRGRMKKRELFSFNAMRGISHYYSYDAVRKFLEDNDLISIIRSHEVQEKGHKQYRAAIDDFPSLITVFSTPNYLDYHTNTGSVFRYREANFNIREFNHVQDLYELPAQPAAAATSIPHFIDKLTDAQLHLMNCALEELHNSTLDDEKSKEAIRNTLNITWMNFEWMREQMKAALREHYQRGFMIESKFNKNKYDKAMRECNPTFEQAKYLNAEDERKRLWDEKPSEAEKINAKNAETEATESITISLNSREK